MKRFFALMFILGCCLAFGQEENIGGEAPNMLTSLAGQFFSGDFVNYNLFFNGLYDARKSGLQDDGGGYINGGGFSVGGGVQLSKSFRRSALSLNYRGEYRNYQSGFQGSGTNQYLSFLYSNRLSTRWSIAFSATGGVIFYNSPYYNSSFVPGGTVPINPLSPTTRFLHGGVFLTYQQTRRLSYVFAGNFLLNRYSYPSSFGSTGGVFSASVVYQLTSRTSVGGTFTHNKLFYQHGAGDSLIDGGFFNVKHKLGRTWQVYASGGVTRVHARGVIQLPIQVIIPGGQPIVIYVTGPYDKISNVPTVQGGIQHSFGKISVGASAGHGVSAGNGSYLTSSRTFFGGSASRAFGRQSVLSANANYSRLKSIANAISRDYNQAFLNVGYSRTLTPHLSANVTYTYSRYGSFYSTGGFVDNRIMLGIAYSSSGIPFTLF